MLNKILVFTKFFCSSFRTLKEYQKIKSFQQLNLPSKVLRHLDSFDTLFEIQSKSMKKLLEGQDIIGIAPTGSGKTIAYAIPALIKAVQLYQQQKERVGPYSIIICPTRELSIQITNILRPFANQFNLRVANLYGGVQKQQQFYLAKLSQIIVATPGRLKDYMLSNSKSNFDNVKYLTLDEADKLLTFGFDEDLRQIINKFPKERQTVMFSATWQKQIQFMAQNYLKTNAYYIQIGSNNISLNPNVQQKFILTTQQQAKDQIIQMFESQNNQKTLIFCNMKQQVKQIAIELNRRTSRRIIFMTSDLSQNQRAAVLNCFRKTPNCILISTDVASRGIDIKDIELIINYGFPQMPTDFIHRIGRTGRGGKLGKSLTYIFKSQKRVYKDLQFISNLFLNQNIAVPQNLQTIIKQVGRESQYSFNLRRKSQKRSQLNEDQIENKFKKDSKLYKQQEPEDNDDDKQTKNN